MTTEPTRMTEGAVDHAPGNEPDELVVAVEDDDDPRRFTAEPAEEPAETGRPPADEDGPVEDEELDRG